jgi:hypothetical protein
VFGETCTYPGGLMRRACGRPTVTACVYCGEPFCDHHGTRHENYTDVCTRRACETKQEDLRLHLEWKARVTVSNDVSFCAQEECGERMRHQCSQCHLLFCADHVTEQDVAESRARGARKVRLLMCTHCVARRKIWE